MSFVEGILKMNQFVTLTAWYCTEKGTKGLLYNYIIGYEITNNGKSPFLFRAKEYESLVETKNSGSDSPYKAK